MVCFFPLIIILALRQQPAISLTSLNDPKKTSNMGRQLSDTNLSIATNYSTLSSTQQIFCPAGYL